MADSPTTVAELIDAFGGPSKFGRVIGKSPSTAGEQKRNGSIPVDYWPKIVEIAKACGIKGVTYETLVKMHAKPDPKEREAAPC